MAKYVTLLAAAYVAGTLRHPHEGALHLDDADADRLVKEGLALDVSDDFKGEAADAAPIDQVVADAPAPEIDHAAAQPHQAEIAPQETDKAEKPARRKAGASKE